MWGHEVQHSIISTTLHSLPRQKSRIIYSWNISNGNWNNEFSFSCRTQVIISRRCLVIPFTWWSKRKASLMPSFFYNSTCLWFPPSYLSQTEYIFPKKRYNTYGSEYPFYFSPLNAPAKPMSAVRKNYFKNVFKISSFHQFPSSQHFSIIVWCQLVVTLNQISWIGLIAPSEHKFLYLLCAPHAERPSVPLTPRCTQALPEQNPSRPSVTVNVQESLQEPEAWT